MSADRSPDPSATLALDEAENVEWFATMTGIKLDLDRQRTPCSRWITHGRNCAATHPCHRPDGVGWILDHALQGRDISGNRCIALAPYRFGSVEAQLLSAWCLQRSITWEVVPVAYWHDATVTVLLRHVEADGRAWVHVPAATEQSMWGLTGLPEKP